MIAALLLPDSLRAQIQSEARAAFPRECCGLIEGGREGDTIHAVALYPARNLSEDADRFEIDPADHFKALHATRANGHEIVGCYHSHPNGVAEISARDRDGATDDGFVWVICATTSKDARLAGFIHENGQFRALKLIETPAA
jgi:proteasome lid subunit RPN8/RPN11